MNAGVKGLIAGAIGAVLALFAVIGGVNAITPTANSGKPDAVIYDGN